MWVCLWFLNILDISTVLLGGSWSYCTLVSQMTVTLSSLVLGPFAGCFPGLLTCRLLGSLFSRVHLSSPLSGLVTEWAEVLERVLPWLLSSEGDLSSAVTMPLWLESPKSLSVQGSNDPASAAQALTLELGDARLRLLSFLARVQRKLYIMPLRRSGGPYFICLRQCLIV